MEDTDTCKAKHGVFPPGVWMINQEERKEILLSVCGVIHVVEEYTDVRTFKPTLETNTNEDD